MTNIIDFLQSEGIPLFPVQKIILKAIYGIPLDDTDSFTITDWREENPRQFTEKTYLEYLYGEGRSSIREVIPGHHYREVVLCAGLRSGKDHITASIAAYEIVRLTSLDRANSLPPQVGVTLVSQDGGLRSNVEMVLRDIPSVQGRSLPGPGGLWFGVSQDRRASTPRVKVVFRNGTRVWIASSSGLVVLDDAAFNKNSEGLFMALAPATVGSIPGGKFIMASAPNGREGFFYEQFKVGMTSHKDCVLSLQIPTWEINPTIPAGVFKKFYDTDPARFYEDYGAEWSDHGGVA
jgi:hypothetical protein